MENTSDVLAGQMVAPPELGYIANYTAGPSGVFMGDDNIAVASSSLPYYDIGPFSTDSSVGPALVGPPSASNGTVAEFGDSDVYVIPRRHTIKENPFATSKGSGVIGVCADGVPFYSNETNKVYSGAITQFTVLNNGSNYINPTALVNGETDPTFKPIVTNGRIVSISGEGLGNFTDIPTVEITSGRNATFAPTFDRFGRITDVTIINGGEYYKDTPTLLVYDQSDRGRGAVLSCTTTNGSITSVTVVGSGIDYNPNATQITALPVGSGAVVVAGVQSYTVDLLNTIKANPNTSLDSGNGFLFNDGTNFGYPAGPVKTLELMGITRMNTHLLSDGQQTVTRFMVPMDTETERPIVVAS